MESDVSCGLVENWMDKGRTGIALLTELLPRLVEQIGFDPMADNRDRTCTDLASQALQVSCPTREVRFAKSSPTCIVPFRRRMPHVFGHGSNSNWSARQDLHLRSLGPRPSMLLLHHALLPRRMVGTGGLVLVEVESAFLGTYSIGDLADPKGFAPSALPPTTGRSAN